MNISKKINHIFFLFFTIGFYLTYSFKVVFTKAITYLLIIILGTTIVDPNTSGGMAYFSFGLIIIVLLMLGEYIRKDSNILGLISHITNQIDMEGIYKTIPRYTWYKHFILFFSLFLIDILKIISGIYCVVYLFIYVKSGIFLNVAVLCMLFLESIIAIPIYIIFCIGLLLKRKFFVIWLRWMCNRYISRVMNHEVKLKDGILHLRTNRKNPSDPESSTPQIFNDLLNASEESQEPNIIIIKPTKMDKNNPRILGAERKYSL